MSATEELTRADRARQWLPTRARLPQLIVLALLLWFVIRPIGTVFWGAVRSDAPGAPDAHYSSEPLKETYGQLLDRGTFYDALTTSLWLSLLVAVGSLVIGGGAAWLIARTDLGGKSILTALIVMPMFYSSLVSIVGWQFLLADRSGLVNGAWRDITGSSSALYVVTSFSGVVLVMITYFVPFVYLILAGPIRGLDGSLEEAAQISGAGGWHMLRTIVGPLLLPGGLAAGLVVFVLAMETFTAPLVLGRSAGVNTLAGWIYLKVRGLQPDLPAAAAGGTALVVLTVLAMWVMRVLSRRSERFVTVTRGFRPRVVRLGRWRTPITALVFSYAIVSSVLPLAAVFLRSVISARTSRIQDSNFTWEAYRDVLSDPSLTEALRNTLLLGVVGGVICVSIGLLVALWKARQSSLTVRAVDYFVTLPVAVPGILIGLGYLWAYVDSPLYLTLTLILLVIVVRFMGIASQAVFAGVSQLDKSLEEAAGLFGAKPARVLRTVTAPVLAPVLAAVWFLMFLDIARELSASVLLYGVGSRTLSILTWAQLEDGQFGRAAALAVLQVLLIGALLVVVRIFVRPDSRMLAWRK